MADIQGNIIRTTELFKEIDSVIKTHIKTLGMAADEMAMLNKQYQIKPSEYVKASKEQIRVEREKIKLEQDQIRLNKLKQAEEQKATKAIKAKIPTLKQLATLHKQEQRNLEKTQGMYNRVQQRVNTLTKQYNDLATKKALNGKLSHAELQELKILEVQLNKYQNTLKKVDANIGKHQRNVGNYKSAYDGLGFSIAQLTREAPAFANSMQTGFMAISNNLPIFFDEIAKTKKEVASLRAEGVKTQGVLGRLAGAFFSLQTLLSVGVTLLTLYGPELFDWAKGLFGVSINMTEVAKTQEWLNEQKKEAISITEEAAKGASTEIATLEILKNTIEDVTVSNEDRNKAVDLLQKKFPKYFKDLQREKILNGEVSDSYNAVKKAILQRATIEAAQSQITTLITKKIELQTAEILKQKELNADVISQVKEETQAKEKLNKQTTKSASLIADEMKAFINSTKTKNKGLKVEDERYEALNKTQQKIIDNEYDLDKAKTSANKTKNEAIELVDKELEALFDLINSLGGLSEEEEKRGKRAKETSVATDNLSKSTESYVKEIQKMISLYEQVLKLYDKNSKEAIYLQKTIDNLKQSIDSMSESIKNGMADLDEWSKGFNKSQKTILDWKNTAEKTLEDIPKSFLKNAGFGSLTTLIDGSFEQMLAGLDSIEDKGERTRKKFALYFNQIADIAKDAFAMINQFSQQNFEQQYDRLEIQKEVAIGFAGESAAAKEEIERQYEEKRKVIARKQAKAQKETALFNAIIGTAQGIVTTIANVGFPGAIPLIALIGAIGAAQIAMISSQQVPQYWQGGTVGGSQQIMVNDDPYGKKGSNYKEVVQKPNGQTLFPTGKNVKMTVPKGTVIHKTYDDFMSSLNSELGLNGIGFSDVQPNININGGVTKSEIKDVMLEHSKSLVNAINSKHGVNIDFNENGFEKYVVKGNTKQKILNARFRGKGRFV